MENGGRKGKGLVQIHRHGQWREDWPWARGVGWVEETKWKKRNWDKCNKMNSKKLKTKKF